MLYLFLAMPSKNAIKRYDAHAYYHVYNRGVAKQPIFLDHDDKDYFLGLIDRHLNPGNSSLRSDGVPYRKFNVELDLLCFCLMSNHFHLLLYQKEDAHALSFFMRSVLTAYTMYFNLRYKRVGTLFQGVYKASYINHESYLMHISRYIHLNPRRYKTYKHSSLPYFIGRRLSPSWLKPQAILDLDGLKDIDYMTFLESYDERKAALDAVKHELADDPN